MTTEVDEPIVEDIDDDASAPLDPVTTVRVLAHRVTGSSRQRLLDAFPCEIVETEPIDLVVVSTRMPLGQVSGALAGFRRMGPAPIVAIVHAGGEDLATELLRSGAAGLVAEGNEPAVAAFVEGGTSDASLVETYDERLGRSRPSDLGQPGRDPITGLPTAAGFEAALAEAAQIGEVPRVGFLRVLNHDDAVRRLSNEASDLLWRRLSAQFREIGRIHAADLYAYAPTMFAFLAPGLSSGEAREMGEMLARAAETFAPSGGRQLALAMGHAGPEVTSEISAVRELAQRAMELACSGSESVVLSADDLSRTLASTTELEVLMRMVDDVEQRQPGGAGRGGRVGELASRLAQQLGFEGLERSQIRLAAHLHEIGKIALPASGADDGHAESGDETYAAAGAAYLRISGGHEVAQAVRHHLERWDGAGSPDGLAAEDIPVGARILAVAVAVDASHDPDADLEARRRAVGVLAEDAGTRFDPTVVAAARSLFAPDRPGIPGRPDD